MGVDFITCSKCRDTFPDCGPNDYCVKGHRLCPNCMPDVPHEWDVDEEDENRAAILARRTDDGELTEAECPCCQMGGTEVERLRARVARLEGALADCVESLEYVNRSHPEATGSWVRHERIAKAKALLDEARARGAVGE